jgi:hypothetical protein
MEDISRVSVHVDQNRELYLSAHGRLPRDTTAYMYTACNNELTSQPHFQVFVVTIKFYSTNNEDSVNFQDRRFD